MLAFFKVLLHWDSAEVQRICDTAQVARDRLQVMSGTQSMRSLLLCFKVCVIPIACLDPRSNSSAGLC